MTDNQPNKIIEIKLHKQNHEQELSGKRILFTFIIYTNFRFYQTYLNVKQIYRIEVNILSGV